MYRQPVISSNLASVGYDASSMTLEIGFNNGSVYQYYNVPSTVYQELMTAASHGSYLAHNVKGIYAYKRII
jgi:hypothetical protein